ncbi:hypothetical protein J1605_023058 [Eschrichtius robustus]|uniref:Uncharacterized protein n=1 Tax=Eschrichtius robustus TaxID=9764 RepID=A0AB34H569_ESCRO|nr:hypothetical protein J1605_023058 [Eschrichtius robustus]
MQRRAAGPVRNEGNRAREHRPGRPRLRARAPGARGQVCGREEARVPPAVPLRLEVRREACSCSRACEDPWGPGYAAPRPRARGAGRGRGRGVRLGFESSGPGGRSGREGRGPNLGRLSWGARPKPRRRGREAWQVP